MKILQVITSIRKASGASTFCGALSNVLSRLGHDVTIAICESTLHEERYRLDERIGIKTVDAIVSSNERYDIVHVHGIWEMADHVVCAWARRHGIPCVLSPHGSLAPWALRHHWLKKKIAWLLWFRHDVLSADCIHVTAESEREWLREAGIRENVSIVPLGTSVATIQDRDERSAREHVLLFVGRVYAVKAIDRLVQAFARLDEETKRGWKLRIVGPDQAGHQGELQLLVHELGLDAYVEFAGPKYDDELDMEYANCDCLALVSHTENFGATIVDAMAHGKPVITSIHTPWREVVERGCGWWVDNDPKTLAGTLTEMMSLSAEARREMGRRGCSLVEEKYTWEAVARSMMASYRQLARR